MFKYIVLLLLLIAPSLFFFNNYVNEQYQGAPPYGESLSEVPEALTPQDRWATWTRPNVPPRVGIQVGHWKNEELPEELEKLKGSTGASGGGYSEWEVNYEIALKLKEMLESEGIDVDIIPATVPEEYWADAFIAIHADGNLNTSVSGYKVAGPWRSYRNNSDVLAEEIDKTYQEATNLVKDPNISRNMRGYYAFSWWRYDHAIHPMTPGAIVETGFLSNYSDRSLLVNNPEIPAEGISNGVINFLKIEGILK